MKKFTYFFLVLLSAVIFYGCATIIHGTDQEIGISSNPSKANVKIDGFPIGYTPTMANLSRGKSHIVRIELDGYLPYEFTIIKTTSGWVWGNIIFGGLIGLAIDAITGGMYELTPEQVQAEMIETKDGVSIIKSSDDLFMIVKLNPKPEWNKIGQLENLNQ